MKKIIALLVMLITVGGGIYAQDAEFRKPVVLVNYFKNAGPVRANEVEKLRASIMSSLSNSGRLNIIDIATEASLSEETKRRMREETIGDELARSGEMRQLGANYILECTANNVVITRKERTNKDKKETYYEAKMTYAINITSTENGTVIFSQNYHSTESADTESEARNETFNCGIACEVLNELAPLEGEVVDTDYTVNKKGKKMRTCYIKLGEIHGVKAGNFFNVCKAKFVAGQAIYEKIGKLEVNKVYEKISECEVYADSEDVLNAMKEYLKMKTVSPESAKPLMVRIRCGSGRLVHKLF